MLREVLILVLVVVALFLGLPPHNVHCELLSKITKSACPPHIVLVVSSLVIFGLALVLAHWEYLFGIVKNVVKVTENFLSK
jgi:hypothetical protein